MCSTQARRPMSWYLDSDCWRDMTREMCIFQNLQLKEGGKIVLGGNQHRQVISGGQVSLEHCTYINNVL